MRTPLRTALAALAGVALAGAALVAPAPAPSALAASAVRDVAGADRFATSAAVSRDIGFAAGGTVFIASGLVAPDALAAGPAAAAARAPILLATSTELTAEVREELARLRPTSIIIVGSEATLAASVADAARAAAPSATVERVGGRNRAETAALLAERWLPSATQALLVNGWAFADAVTAASAGAARGIPVLLTAGGELLPETRDRLAAARPATTTVLGSAATVAEGVVEAARAATGRAVERIGGVDRTETNALAVRTFFDPAASTQGAVIATARNFPDALVASAYGRLGAPVLLSHEDCATGPTRRMLDRFARNEGELIRRVGGAVAPGAWEVGCRLPAEPYATAGMARYDVSPHMVGALFIRMNEIRVENGLAPLRTDQVRVGTGAFSQRSTDMVQNILDVRAGTAAPLDDKSGLLTDNEVYYRNSRTTFHDLSASGLVEGWWNAAEHRSILFQPTGDKPYGGPGSKDAILVLVVSAHEVTTSWEGAYDARGTWIRTSSALASQTAPITAVDASLRDYVPPAIPAGARYDAARTYSPAYVHVVNMADVQSSRSGGANTLQFPPIPMGPPPPQRI